MRIQVIQMSSVNPFRVLNVKTCILFLFIIVFFAGCRSSDTPDVSDIKVNLETQRFEKDFFATGYQ